MKNRDSFDKLVDGLLLECDKEMAESYKFCKEQGWDDLINDNMLKSVSEGAYASINGSYDGVEEGYIPYFNYLKYGNQYQQEEVKEEPMIENNYETPYSFEYEPYMIEFNHEITYNEPIQEVVYEEPVVEEETCDINELISIVDVLTNKISKVKKTIIHYISNYRPIINQYTGDIDTILIE